MKNKKVTDERVKKLNQKIESEAFRVLLYGLFLYVFIEKFALNAPPKVYEGESYLLLITSIYIVARRLMLGSDLFNGQTGQKMLVLRSILCGFFTAIGYIIVNFNSFDISLCITTFVSSAITFFIVFEIMYFINNKKQQNINKKLDNDN